jgi:hypothetical protein
MFTLFIYVLFNDAVTNSDNILLNNKNISQ